MYKSILIYTLKIKPQSYFYLGIIISGTTLILCFGYAFYRKRREKLSPHPALRATLASEGQKGRSKSSLRRRKWDLLLENPRFPTLGLRPRCLPPRENYLFPDPFPRLSV